MLAIEDVIKQNRDNLDKVDQFIDDADYTNSPDNYGLPPHVRHLIDKPLNDKLTYVDLLMYLQAHLKCENLKYVEIGVSVLKTFYQVASFLKNSELYAYDINDINPTIEKKFTKVSESSQFKKFTHNTNNITYFKGDVFKAEDFNSFKKEVGGKVNVIFSDAHHTGEGLKSEFENYIKDALSEDFILYYDDLETTSMNQYFQELCHQYKSSGKKVSTAFVMMNGWLGQHEHTHLNGIITSLDLKSILPQEAPVRYL
tara:strand:+ start:31251 stop:32018 length:768 start_codon:yes stop_codon:yes gene_type:complete